MQPHRELWQSRDKAAERIIVLKRKLQWNEDVLSITQPERTQLMTAQPSSHAGPASWEGLEAPIEVLAVGQALPSAKDRMREDGGHDG